MVDVQVGPSVPLQQLMRARGVPVQTRLVPLLVDTGASHTAIDDAVVSQLGILSNGRAFAHTMSTGGMPPPSYKKYDLSLVLTSPKPGRSFQVNQLSVSAPTNQPFGGLPYLGILGRDVLDLGILSYDGSGQHFTLSF